MNNFTNKLLLIAVSTVVLALNTDCMESSSKSLECIDQKLRSLALMNKVSKFLCFSPLELNTDRRELTSILVGDTSGDCTYDKERGSLTLEDNIRKYGCSLPRELNTHRRTVTNRFLGYTNSDYTYDQKLRLLVLEDDDYKVSKFRCFALLAGYTGTVVSALFSPDGTTIFSIQWGGKSRLWDVETRNHIQDFYGWSSYTSGVFSPDGNVLLIGALDKTAGLWDARTGKQRLPNVQISPFRTRTSETNRKRISGF